MNKQCKEGKKMIQKGSEALGMAKPKENHRIWRRTRFRSWTWHKSSLFWSIQLHPCKKIKWSCKNTSSLHKKTNENIYLEEKSTWYLYKIIRNHSPWKDNFPHQNPLISESASQYWESTLNGREHIPRLSQSLEFQNMCHNSIISCWFIIYIDPPIVGSKSLNYLLQIFVICLIFS